jgi:diaminopropionate ammonia-lyase
MTLAFRAVANPMAGPLECPAPTRAPLAFHRRLPGYVPTPLLSVPQLAGRLGVRELLVKCESARFGLPSFKMLGASWATYRALCERAGLEAAGEAGDGCGAGDGGDGWRDLAEKLSVLRPLTLVAATDGNHGRAVARMARLLGFEARIFVPAGTSPRRIDAIAQEGAEVEVVDGGFDDAVRRSAKEDGPHCLIVSDTSWSGYTDVPGWVIEGYSTMFFEITDALEACDHARPDLVVVPVGVGALGAAAVAHFRPQGTHIIGVEPTDAACVTASVLAGERRSLDGAQRSMMVGLNCGTPSLVAWPIVSRGIDGFVDIDDDWTRQAVRDLAAAGIEAGETGAAALAGLSALQVESRSWGELPDTPLADLAEPESSVLVLVTEGATDVTSWRAILGVEEIGALRPA